ncbi:MAG: hypothetical protein ACLPVW_08585 [Terriglobales bacterium]
MTRTRIKRYCAGILGVGLMGVGLGMAQASPPTSGQTAAPASAPTSVTYQPKFPGDPARSESEAQALGYMRTLLRAQHEYKKRHDKFADSLEELAGTGSFTKRMAHTTDRGDYTASFLAHFGPHNDGFVLTMTPKQMDSEHRSFYAEDDGAIHADDQKPADLDSPKVK